MVTNLDEHIPIAVTTGYEHLDELSVYPWKWESDSIDEFKCVDVLGYIKAPDRPKFMDELYRILVDGGKAVIIVPYYSTAQSYADYAVEWPPICEQSFLYFNKSWRLLNNLESRGIKADFEFNYGYILDPEIASRSIEVQSRRVKNEWNTVQRIQATLTKNSDK